MKISQAKASAKIPAKLDLSVLPKSAQQKVYRVYLSVKKTADKAESLHEEEQYGWGENDCMLLSEAALAKDWLSKEDEEAWKEYQPK